MLGRLAETPEALAVDGEQPAGQIDGRTEGAGGDQLPQAALILGDIVGGEYVTALRFGVAEQWLDGLPDGIGEIGGQLDARCGEQRWSARFGRVRRFPLVFDVIGNGRIGGGCGRRSRGSRWIGDRCFCGVLRIRLSKSIAMCAHLREIPSKKLLLVVSAVLAKY